jgi:hypothetical protein
MTVAVRRLVWACLVAACATPAAAADFNALRLAMNSITADEAKVHIDFLASDTLEGREAGARGGLAAGGYLVAEFKKLGLAPAGKGAGYFQPFGNQYRNILGLLEGSDPTVADELILIGAHYDHVGYGNRSNSYGPIGYIHNGADDNASGVAGLLETIDAVTRVEPRPRRSILFVLWDGEEKGLLGSKHWVHNPTLPDKRVVLAINADMIGRMQNGEMHVYGTRTGPGLRALVSEANTEFGGLKLLFSWDMRADSDHYSFFERQIPTLMVHSGLHNDYHRPSDDVEKLNLDGVVQGSRLMMGIVYTAADAERLPAFRSRAATENAAQQALLETPLAPLAGRLGVTWDPDDESRPGVRITGVGRQSSAARSGLLPGDRILQFGDRVVGPHTDLRPLVLAAENPVRVLVERVGEAEPVELAVELDGAPLRLGFSWREDDAEPGRMVVARVVPGSPAEAAGLEVKDRVAQVAGQSFANGQEFAELVRTVEGNVELLVERDGLRRSIVLSTDGSSPGETSL